MAQRGLFPDEPPPLAPATPRAAMGGRSLFPADPLHRTLEQARETSSDEAARVLDLRLTTGLSPTIIRRYRGEIEREVARRDFDAETFRRTYPKLAAWLEEDATTAAAAQPDLPALQQIEAALTFGAAIRRGVDQVEAGAGGFLEFLGEATGFETLTDAGRGMRERNRVEMDARGRRTSVFALRGPWDLAQWLKETVGEQLPVMAPMVGGAAAGFAVAGPVGAAIGAVVPSVILGVGEVQGAVKAISPETQAPAAAFIGGSAIAALDSVVPGRIGATLVRTFGREAAEQIATRALLTPVKPGWLRTTARGTVRGLTTEGLTEAVQEAIGAVAAASGTSTAVPADLWRQMVEAGAAGAVMGGLADGTTAAATVRRRQAQAAAAQQQVAFFTALATGVTESQLYQQAPAAVREFLQRATKDGPVEFVYAPVDTFVQYFQRNGLSPDVIAQQLTGQPDALEAARAAGVDLQIPTASYALTLAGTEHHAFFAKELRLDPRQLNLREVEALAETTVEATADQQARAANQQAAAEEVFARLERQALETGARPEVATAWATLWAQRFVTRAQRLGVDPAELLRTAPPPAIVSGEPVSIDTAPIAIPPSPATPRETPAQRAHRRQVHVAALTRQVVADAQRVDPTVDPAMIRRELDFRVGFEEERQAAARESGQGQDLLRAIAGYGGLWWEPRTGAYKGEIELLVEHGRDIRDTRAGRIVPERGRATYNGVPGVFREDGRTPDGMVEALRQDPRFEYIADINDLFDAIDAALRTARDVDELPGSQELRRLGIVPGTRWWHDRWTPDAELAQRGSVVQRIRALLTTAPTVAEKAKEARAAARAHPAAPPAALPPPTIDEFTLFQDPGDIKGAYHRDTNTIRLIAGKADLSTFLHESGHAFLEELVADATSTHATPQLRGDAETVLRWFGFQGTLQEWRALPLDARREHHEQFARGFEAYLREGRAPTVELQSVFAQFRAWLVAIYRSLRRLRVEVTPEVSSVMDRLLASDEAIAAAEAETGFTPLFTTPEAAGVDAEAFAALQARFADARRRAHASLDRRLLEEQRREVQAWYQHERALVRASVVDEVMREPVFIAQSVIRTGKLPNGEIPDFGDGRPIKLSKADIVSSYGAEVLRRLPKPYLYAVEGGLPVDTVAALVGFPSGDALLAALTTAPRVDRVIEEETDRRLRERHGDLRLEPAPLREAAEAAVTDGRFAVVAEELRLLSAKAAVQATVPPADVLRASAATRIARTTVRELRPGLFLVAAQQASRRAFETAAAGDLAGAVPHKQRELFALALYRAAREAKDQVLQRRKQLLEYDTNPTVRARIGKAGGDYLDQIDQVLERYEFTRVTHKALDKRESLRTFVAKLERQGLPIELPEEVLDDARHINYQELTVEELEGVYQAVEQLAHLARLKNKLLKAVADREFKEVTAALAASIRQHATKTRSRQPESNLPGQQGRRLVEAFTAAHRKIASLAREMDGFRDGGPLWEYVIRPLNDAADREAAMHAEATRALRALFDRYTPAERASWFRLEHMPALGPATDEGAQLSKAGRLTLALNWGNETNRQRVRDGRGWTDDQVQAVLDTLDRRDWEFVQAVWDYLETFRPLIAEKQKRVVGVEPEWVDPTPVFTRFGEFRGGYYPIRFDGEQAAKPGAHEEANLAELHKVAAYATATTRRGHLQRRAEGDVTIPVKLDFGVLVDHVGQVIHDLTHHEALIDVGRILRDEAVSQAIIDTQGAEVYRHFKNTLRDVAFGQLPARDGVEQAVNHIRQGSTIVGLGWNLTTALLQPLGLTQSIQRLGAKWVGRGVASWLGSPRRMQATVDWIQERSAFMRMRAQTINREINEVRNQVGLDLHGRLHPGTWVDVALRAVTRDRVAAYTMANTYFSLIQKFQLVADVPTWLGAYEKAMADPANVTDEGTVDEARAIALADQAVIDSQGSGYIKDLASAQRGSAYLKLLTNFYSFFNVTYNRAAEAYRQTKARPSPTTVARLAGDYLLLLVVPAVLGSLLRDALAGEDEPEQLVENAIREQLSYVLGTMVFLREGASALQGFPYEGPAGLRPIAAMSRFIRQASDAIVEGDPRAITSAGARGLNTAAGALFHYPAGQVDRTVRGAIALLEGETWNPLALLVGPPAAAR